LYLNEASYHQGFNNMSHSEEIHLRYGLICFAIVAAFGAGLLHFNTLNLSYLVKTSETKLTARVVLWALGGIVFAGVQMPLAVMILAIRHEDDSSLYSKAS
jgi:hypothetical protein